MALEVPPKDPDEVLDYKIDWAERLEGDTIVSAEWAVEEGDIAVGVTTNTASETTVWLSNGTIGRRCLVRCRITTVAGRTMDQSIKVPIRAK
jgi:hypothetical protein